MNGILKSQPIEVQNLCCSNLQIQVFSFLVIQEQEFSESKKHTPLKSPSVGYVMYSGLARLFDVLLAWLLLSLRVLWSFNETSYIDMNVTLILTTTVREGEREIDEVLFMNVGTSSNYLIHKC